MNQASPQDSALVIFTGLVAELNPADLPQGAAAIACDVDFTVGSAKTRYGVESVYTFTDLNVVKAAGLGTSAPGPGTAWTNPDNIVSNTPGTYASVTISGLLAESKQLQASTFGFALPVSSVVLGIQLQVNGKQTSTDMTFTATPIGGSTNTSFTLPSTDGSAIMGGIGSFFGLTGITAAQVNSPGFGFNIIVSSHHPVPKTADISGVVVRVWFSPAGITNFDHVASFQTQNGTLLTLAIDDTGILWQEDVLNAPGVLTEVYGELEPDSFAVSVTYDDREWIALSDLQQATDMPRQYNGQWVDRVSQVAPGAPPSVAATSATYPIISITQPAAVASPTLSALLWSVGPGNQATPGNVITLYYGTPGASAPATVPDPNIIIGNAVRLASFPTVSGLDPNGTYIVNSIQTTLGSGGFYNTFCVTAPSSGLHNFFPVTSGSYQATLATLTTSVPIPNVQVGSQISVSGASVPAWDQTWTILYTPNAAQLEITATSLSGNVATYAFNLISGTTPAVGEQVTVTGTNNGGGIFNVTNATINSISAGQFSISLVSPNIAPAAETGSGIINGTIFQFDPGIQFVGTVTDPIFGNSTGGTIALPGNLGAGQRMAVVMFQTRNDFITPCSNPVTFFLTEGANSLVCTNIPIGPADVTKRIIAFTGSGGAFFFYIDEPVTITDNGVKTTYTSTVVNDNTSTQATFTFTDAVLLAGTSIDTQGSNQFETIELGSCTGFVPYSSRMFAWGEQNKIQNLINISFDGGFLPNPGSPLVPLGWTVDPIFGPGGSLVMSPLFGNAYQIQNTSGGTVSGSSGMITQTAYQDYFQVPIINTNTQYGVRVTAANIGGVSTGNLVIDLFSPSFNRQYGNFTIPFASLTPTMQILTGDLLTTEFFSAVPSDLLYRIYATGTGNLSSVVIDRTEPFDLSQPVLTTQLRGSYENNFEAFDDVTGNLGVAVTNQQEVRCCFELFDNLYVVKTGSFDETSDNGITEPDDWDVKQVSNKVGTDSIHGVDVGEGWALIAGIAGLYVFEGGKPVKISPEIDPLWATINWKYGYTIWVRNDTNNRRISIGVPLATPNQWMPQFPVNSNPTQPNVVLTLNYKELMSAAALQSEGSIRQGYTGQLRSFQFGRRWSVWSIEAAYADFITRGDTTEPLFYCADTGNAKIYQQITGNFLDDGLAIPWRYTTYPFLKSEEAQQIHAGLHNLITKYGSALVIGEGNVSVTVYPDTLDTPYADRLLPLPLFNPPSWGDTEFPMNDVGNRFFVDFQPINPGDWMEISRLVLTVAQNPWAPIGSSANAY